MTARRYSDEEVQQILRVALERERHDPAGLERDEIVGAAAEIGIDAASIDRAIAELEVQRQIEVEVATIRSERRASLFSHASTWLLVNAMLFAVDWADGGGYWFYWPLCGWGIAVLIQARRTLFPSLAKDRKKAQRRIAKREKQRAQQARKAKRKQAEQQIEAAFEQGVSTLLTAAADRLAASLDTRRHAKVRITSPRDARVEPDGSGTESADEPAARPRTPHAGS